MDGYHRLGLPPVIYTISLGTHRGTGENLPHAIGSLMLSVVKRGTPEEIEDLGQSMIAIQEMGATMEKKFDISSGLPEERQ